MRLFVLLGIASLCVPPALAQSGKPSTDNAPGPARAPKPAPFPLQLEVHVPFAPTAFPSDGSRHLLYELHLTNFGSAPLSIHRIEVLEADTSAAKPVVAFEPEQLDTMLMYVGGNAAPNPKDGITIANGQRVVVFMSVTFDAGSQIPGKLIHRIITPDSEVEDAVISTNNTTLHVLGPPVEGADWLAADGPDNDPDNHHRRGVVILDGRAVISRRYAIDWKQVRDGVSFSGDSQDVHSYYAYDKTVLAVADGRVVAARDGLPNNIPGHGSSFHPAIPLTLETLAGNTITLDLGGGQFAYYMHLQPGSLRIKVGDTVRRGQILAHVGCSGDAREPHLHFEVTVSSKPLSGEGVPYLIDRYHSKNVNGSLELHTHELPLNKSVVVFEEHGR